MSNELLLKLDSIGLRYGGGGLLSLNRKSRGFYAEYSTCTFMKIYCNSRTRE